MATKKAELEREIQKLRHLVNITGRQMERKLLKKARQGWRSWDAPLPRFQRPLRAGLQTHVAIALKSDKQEDYIDVMAFAAFLWHASLMKRWANAVRLPRGR